MNKLENELTRSFICIEFPDEIIKEVARVQEVLENQKFNGKMTELENLHLALKFLGEINQETLNKVKEALRKIEFKEMELKLGKAGIFHYKGNPKIVWLKIQGKKIYELQEKIDKALEGLFKKEERFMGHLTLARIKYLKDKKAFEEYIKNLGTKEITFKINSFSLKKSDLRPLGPIYTTLEDYKSKEKT